MDKLNCKYLFLKKQKKLFSFSSIVRADDLESGFIKSMFLFYNCCQKNLIGLLTNDIFTPNIGIRDAVAIPSVSSEPERRSELFRV